PGTWAQILCEYPDLVNGGGCPINSPGPPRGGATRAIVRGCGAAGSAPAWHAGGQGFESPQLHQGVFPELGCDTTKGAWPLVRRSSRLYPVCCGRGALLRAIASSGRLVFLDASPGVSSRSVVGADFGLFARSEPHEPRTGGSSAGAVVGGVGAEARPGRDAETVAGPKRLPVPGGPAAGRSAG